MKLKDLLNQKKVVDAELAALQKESEALDVLIASQRKREGLPPESGSPPGAASNNGDGERQKRVRGTLKAAKQTIAEGDIPNFTRSGLFSRIGDRLPALAGKISPEAQRSTIRTLIADGVIEPTDMKSEGEMVYRKVT